MASLLSFSALHCVVHPLVNASGNHATTTVLPRSSDNLCVLPSVPTSEKSGALSPDFFNSAAFSPCANATAESPIARPDAAPSAATNL